MTANICVIGGGAAGCVAALAAARKGATVILVEKNEFLGGTARSAMHAYLCGYFANDPVHPFTFLNNGIAEEFARGWIEKAVSDPCVRVGRVELLAIESNLFWNDLEKAVTSHPNIRVLSGHTCVAATRDEHNVSAVTLFYDSKQDAVSADAFVDASGDAVLAEILGTTQHDDVSDLQQTAVCMALRGCEQWNEDDALAFTFSVHKAAESGELPRSSRFANAAFERYGKRLIVKYSAIALDANVHAAIVRILASRPNAKSVRIEKVSPLLYRSGPRGIGEYTITADDVSNAAVFPDAVAYAGWPMEFWHREHGLRFKYALLGKAVQIPARALCLKTFNNVFLAGRAISADAHAASALRVCATAFATGEQAAYLALGCL
jgi:hypothetical protein